ncbi:hypothetical protein [Candidatus Nitrososphaera evergladensis]|uniref:hypothetical protein n=1 Tax=Candidatus Nitrososphaera evergladensis TaxID=1459637 RepID=UPI001D0576C9|nr:hypothetical protein [Candidatus Nitrososphaera evergladensis]
MLVAEGVESTRNVFQRQERAFIDSIVHSNSNNNKYITPAERSFERKTQAIWHRSKHGNGSNRLQTATSLSPMRVPTMYLFIESLEYFGWQK